MTRTTTETQSHPSPRVFAQLILLLSVASFSGPLHAEVTTFEPRPPPAAESGADNPRLAGKPSRDPAKRVAISYLKALEGKGDANAREFLLGGATLTAEDFQIPNWRIQRREPVRRERADIAGAKREMRGVRDLGRDALERVMNLGGGAEMEAVSERAAEKMMGPTRLRAARFQKRFPVFAYLSRVDKDLFWHPANPFNDVVAHMGEEGQYRAELHLFRIVEKEPGQKARVWPLRILRLKTKTFDTGWKVLPASDWDPEY